jgi:large subunit ribosomal protein L23
MMNDPFHVVKRPLVTEKNMARAEARGIYTFEVALKSNKVQIRHAVETLFKVGVVDVRTSIAKGLAGRSRMGYKTKDPNLKKAIVTLKKGDKIDIL